jgi:galactonate dehydratase
MKITDVKPFPVWVGRRNQMLVKIETDKGIYGWGESGFSGRELAVEGIVRHYREILLGKDPTKREAIWQELYRSQYFEGGRTITAALSAIDIALHDIAGKAWGVPVYELLGGKQRDYVPGFATTSASPGPEMIKQGLDLLDKGWTAFRLSVVGDSENIFEPRESIAKTSEWLIKAREEIGPKAVLGVDYHHRLTVAETASFCQMMPIHTLDFLEEPIRDECPEAYESLRKLTPQPLAIGEEFASKWQFLPYIERGITNYARLDICNVGGFTEAMKVAGWAEAHYIDVMPHNPLGPICTAASVHFGASIPNFSWLEARITPSEPNSGKNSENIYKEQIKLEGAWYPVPDTPGLGIEVNENALQKPFKHWNPPALRRRDGSWTNW